MLVVIFSILKWMGIILLSLFGLLLVAIICVLMVPVRYRLDLCLGDGRQLKGTISWLLHLIHVSFYVSEEKTDYKIRIAGISLAFLKNHAEKRKKRKEKKKRREKKHSRRVKPQPEPSGLPQPEQREDHPKTSMGEAGRKAGLPEPERQAQRQKPVSDRVRHFLQRIRDFFLSIGAIFGKIKNGIRRIVSYFEKRASGNVEKGTLSRVVCILRDENTPELLGLLRQNLGFLWRHTRPSRVKGWVRFGTEDPCTTGQLLGAVSLVFAMWGNAITVIPDFEESVLEGEVEIKGRLHFVVLLIILIKILPNRQWRRFRKQWDA